MGFKEQRGATHRLKDLPWVSWLLLDGLYRDLAPPWCLPGYEEYIKNDTRGNKILDKCYENVKDAYVTKSKPPLSYCDRNMIHLIPDYRTLWKRWRQFLFDLMTVFKGMLYFYRLGTLSWDGHWKYNWLY